MSTKTLRRYRCQHCTTVFPNVVYRSEHVRRVHPETLRRHRGDGALTLAAARTVSRLKRATDVWPSRP